MKAEIIVENPPDSDEVLFGDIFVVVGISLDCATGMRTVTIQHVKHGALYDNEKENVL